MSDLPDIPEGYDPIAAETPGGLQLALDYRVIEWREDFAKVELVLSGVHGNRSGAVHGGVFATLIDSAGGYAGCYCPYPGRVRRAVTLSLTTNYMGQPKGKTLIATARKVGGGTAVFFCDLAVHDELGNLCVTGSGTFRYRTGSRTPEGQAVT